MFNNCEVTSKANVLYMQQTLIFLSFTLIFITSNLSARQKKIIHNYL